MQLVVVGFEIADHGSGFEQAGPMVAVEAFMPKRRLNGSISVVPQCSGGI